MHVAGVYAVQTAAHRIDRSHLSLRRSSHRRAQTRSSSAALAQGTSCPLHHRPLRPPHLDVKYTFLNLQARMARRLKGCKHIARSGTFACQVSKDMHLFRSCLVRYRLRANVVIVLNAGRDDSPSLVLVATKCFPLTFAQISRRLPCSALRIPCRNVSSSSSTKSIRICL